MLLCRQVPVAGDGKPWLWLGRRLDTGLRAAASLRLEMSSIQLQGEEHPHDGHASRDHAGAGREAKGA
jgi:hypothetical protein